jgi:pimeloyl-ACP methyl ester carboxylesterase
LRNRLPTPRRPRGDDPPRGYWHPQSDQRNLIDRKDQLGTICYNRPGAKPSEAIIANWWRQGMMGGARAHYDGIVAFSQTDFTEDLKKITVPVLVMHSEDDQIVPYVAAGPLSAKLLKNGTLKTYKDFPHGMPTTQAETINVDLLSFIQANSSKSSVAA